MRAVQQRRDVVKSRFKSNVVVEWRINSQDGKDRTISQAWWHASLITALERVRQ